MSDVLAKIFLPFTFILLALYWLFDVVSHPAALNGSGYLAGVIFLEVVVVALWDFRRRFFPFLIVIFLMAGMSIPLADASTSARWLVLAAGAIAGIIIYLRDNNHSFLPFHLVALFCVIAALVSAMVSAVPKVALFKALSLLLAFLYAASGARLAVRGREAKFCAGLLLGAEGIVYFTAVCYFGLHRAIFGNPNSLGAVMGVGAIPILLWGLMIDEGKAITRRRTLALIVAVLLLLSSYARAAILGAAVSSLLLCFCMRRYRMVIKGSALAVAAAVLVATFSPVTSGRPGSVIAAFLYKGHEDLGLMGSRKSPWDTTTATIQQHPFFGGGFGTSAVTADAPLVANYSTTATVSREHGNSYMAILEWVGLIGVIPFAALLVMVVLNIARVFAWLRRTSNPYSVAVPLATILAAGLVNATFEDWLFAVGFYLCIFFWCIAFMLADLVHVPATVPEQALSPLPTRSWDGSYGIAAPGQ